MSDDTGAVRHTRRRRSRSADRRPQLPIFIAVIAFAGLLLLLYPTIAAWFTQYEQSMEIDQYSGTVRNLGPGDRTGELDAADAYNDSLTDGSSIVAANERKPLSGDDAALHDVYESLLDADGQGLMARLRIPSIEADLPIFHGTTDDVLEKGIGHLEGTALPVGGEGTHAVLTGHRGLATAELFDHLDQVKIGDTFTIEVYGEVLTYQVTSTTVVEPQDTQTLYPQAGEDLLTLITCTPLGINSHRILVTGDRVLPTPVEDLASAGERPEVPRFPWWAVGLGGSIVVLALYVWVARRPHRSEAARTPVIPGTTGSAAGRAE
ncbi:class C sortase [Microbacterium tenebrionis]|uniref:class C sortase n=1 Tax=Microbacterium tenebrionis TaxID=2830665 RepID=UPI00158AD27E|nr:class C sortase [Microbacterium ihumii]